MSIFMNQYFGLFALCAFIGLAGFELGEVNCPTPVVTAPVGPPECAYYGKLESRIMYDKTHQGQPMVVKMPETHAWTCPDGVMYVK